jgi:hypothetical protein
MHTQDYVFDSSAVDSSTTTIPTAVVGESSPVRVAAVNVSASVRRSSATSDALITDTRFLYDVMSGDEKIILSGSDESPIQRPKSTSGNKTSHMIYDMIYTAIYTSASVTIAQLLLFTLVRIKYLQVTLMLVSYAYEQQQYDLSSTVMLIVTHAL